MALTHYYIWGDYYSRFCNLLLFLYFIKSSWQFWFTYFYVCQNRHNAVCMCCILLQKHFKSSFPTDWSTIVFIISIAASRIKLCDGTYFLTFRNCHIIRCLQSIVAIEKTYFFAVSVLSTFWQRNHEVSQSFFEIVF